ncbi:MAG TPA: hypothetical protein VMX55_03710 [candidate division Zixibacteria bacterium]|nr:hypothetical protein [candidate division Zixibacteria bacterium]
MSKNDLEIIQGSGKLHFEKRTRIAKIRSPLANFEVVEQKIEYRKDPLLDHWSRINALRAERVKQATNPGENYETNLKELIAKSAEKCFFCPQNVQKSTPKFPEEINLGERIIRNNFALFPNLFVFSENHAVGVLGEKHFTPLNEISPEIWKEAIMGSIEYFKALYKTNKEIVYPSINFNFLPPSASSIIHPHIQIIQDVQPTEMTEKLLKKSREYFENSKQKNNFWIDLIETEKKLKSRLVSDNDFMTWVATYSPIGKNELTGICKIPKTDITQFNEQEATALANEICKALNALYQGRGVRSVNMALYIGPIEEDVSEYFRINIRIVSRPTLEPNYTGDIGFMELLHTETIAEASPEIIAETVREYFKLK